MEILFHGVGHYAAGAPIGPACWPHWDLIVVVRGRVRFQSGRQTWGHPMMVDEGAAVLIPPGTRFRGTGEAPHTTIWVIHFADPARPLGRTVRRFAPSASDPFLRGLLTEISLVVRRNTPEKDRSYRAALVTALLEKFFLAGSGRPREAATDGRVELPRIEDLELREEEGFPTTRDLAAAAGLSISHHRALFKSHHGMSPGCHLRRLRLVYARKLLRETGLPIKQVARRAGYRDVVSFHRAFVTGCGLTPARFRSGGRTQETRV